MFSSLLGRFAAEETGPAIHIAPQAIFKIGDFSVSNSMLFAWITTSFILGLFIWAAHRISIKPKKGIAGLVEVGTEFITGLLESNFGDRKKALKYAPYFIAIFFFITLTNWIGLMPGVGEALTVGGSPLFRPFTADLNGTLAAATVTMIMVQYFAIKESGIKRHARHYFQGSLKNPVTYLMGSFEVFSELTRIISLALRLFLNVAIGEIIIAVFAYLGNVAAPITALPFLILEMLVGILQAYIFVMLSVVYLAVAIKHDHDDVHQPEPESVAPISELRAKHG